MLRLLDLGSLGDRAPPRAFQSNRQRGRPTGRRISGSRGGSQIVIEIDGRGRSRSRGFPMSSSRNDPRFVDPGFGQDSRRSQNSFGRSILRDTAPLPSDNMISNSRNPTEIVFVSRGQSSDRHFMTEPGSAQFADVGMQRTSQPVAIHPHDQVVTRSEFIRTSRPAQDRLISSRPAQDRRVSPDPLGTPSGQTGSGRGGWQQYDPRITNTGFDVLADNTVKTSTVIREPAVTSVMTSGSGQQVTSVARQQPDIIQTSTVVKQSGTNTISVPSSRNNVGTQSAVSSQSLTAPAPAPGPNSSTSGSIQNMLRSIVDRMDRQRSARPTEEPMEIEEILARRLMANPTGRLI